MPMKSTGWAMSAKSGRGPVGPRLAEDFLQLVGIVALERGIEILAVHVGVGARRRGNVLGPVAGRIFGLDIDHQPDLVRADLAIDLHRRAMRAHEIVAGDRGFEHVLVPGRERAVEVAAVGHHPRFVERDPFLDPAVEPLEQDPRIIGEPVGAVAVEPAAAVVERGRHVPVVERAAAARCRWRSACRPAARRRRARPR